MLGSERNLKMHIRNLGYQLPRKIGDPKPFFAIMATLMAYIFGKKHDIHNQQVRWKLQGVSYIASKRNTLWFTNGL